MTNSRRKGKRGELEVASLFRDHGWPARRTQQYSGTEGDADVTVENMSLHVEVKFRERLNLYEAMRRAIIDSNREAGGPFPGDVPVIFHRRKHDVWHVTMLAEDWFKMLREAHDLYWSPRGEEVDDG